MVIKMVFFTYFGIHFENDLVYKDSVYTVHTMSCTHVVYGADKVMHKLGQGFVSLRYSH